MIDLAENIQNMLKKKKDCCSQKEQVFIFS